MLKIKKTFQKYKVKTPNQGPNGTTATEPL